LNLLIWRLVDAGHMCRFPRAEHRFDGKIQVPFDNNDAIWLLPADRGVEVQVRHRDPRAQTNPLIASATVLAAADPIYLGEQMADLYIGTVGVDAPDPRFPE
jgi:hypothetical protein